MIIETCPLCGKDLENIIYATYPPIRAVRCVCGYKHEEREKIIREPYNPDAPAKTKERPGHRLTAVI